MTTFDRISPPIHPTPAPLRRWKEQLPNARTSEFNSTTLDIRFSWLSQAATVAVLPAAEVALSALCDVRPSLAKACRPDINIHRINTA
jgi:hypothetical protein